MPQLLRDNEGDLRVTEDVRKLADAYDEAAVATSYEAMRQARRDDIALLTEAWLGRPPSNEPLSKRVREHVVGYRLFYGIGAVVLLVLLFMNPLPKPLLDGDDTGTALIPTSDAAAPAPVSNSTPAPLITDIAADFALPNDAFPEPSIADEPSPTIETVVVADPPAPTLRITQSGYASSLAGTPADEAAPSNGLPVEATFGQATKYSYIKLAGTARVLRLKPMTGEGTSSNPGQARLQLCPINGGWQAARGVAFADAPKYGKSCLGGALTNGLWTFTFSEIFDPLAANGWAIVPVDGGNANYKVTLSSTAV